MYRVSLSDSMYSPGQFGLTANASLTGAPTTAAGVGTPLTAGARIVRVGHIITFRLKLPCAVGP